MIFPALTLIVIPAIYAPVKVFAIRREIKRNP